MTRTMHYDQEMNQEELRANLDLLTERCELISVREPKYKKVMARYYNKRVLNTQYRVGDLVLINKKASHTKNSGKLDANWKEP